MDIIIETDLGRDPDDFFAICWFVSVGVNIRAITISPGDKDQIAIANFLCKELGLSIPIGSANPNRNKLSSGGVHYDMLNKYGHTLSCEPDDIGSKIIDATMKQYPSCELFVCGPLQNVGPYLANGGSFPRATMQGGFIGYDVHKQNVQRLDKFERKTTEPTFNLNGDVKSGLLFGNTPFPKSFVSKNVCHTVIYDKTVHERVLSIKSKNRAGEIFREAMTLYLSKHSEKKFHDPTAAVCHLFPEIATWVNGSLYRENGGWGWKLGQVNDKIIVDIDREQLWNKIEQV